MESLNLIDVAFDAREKGFVAVPCHPGTKIPTVKWKRWQAEMPPAELLADWFRMHTRSNIAILTTGLVVFDVDELSNAELVLRECGDTPHKLRTPRGGIHLGYRRRKGTDLANHVQVRGLPIDIRTNGGVELIPPSSTIDGAYSWLGSGLHRVSELPLANIGWTRSRVRRNLQHVTINTGESAALRARAYIAHIEGAIAGQRGHHQTMRVAGILVQKFGLTIGDAWPLFLEWNEQCEPPWSEKELLHKLQDAERLKARFLGIAK